MKLMVPNCRASYYVGGTEVVSLRQSIELARHGHEIVELVRTTDEPTEYFEEFVETISDESLPITVEEVSIDAPMGDGMSWTDLNGEALAFGREATPSYLRHIKDGIDLCVTHLITDSIFVPQQVASTLHLHGNPFEPDMLIDSAMVVNGGNLIADSESIKDWWSTRYPNNQYDVFRNGVDTDRFNADPRGKRPIDVLYVGRFLGHKGIDDILYSVSPDSNVVIAGSGPYEQTIRQIIKARGLNNVELVTSPANYELQELYGASKIFVCPSRGKEGVLTTMLEAASSGCAVVTSRGSGMTDLISDAENGLLVEPGDTGQIAKAINGLLNDDESRIALAERVQADVISGWSWTVKGKELEKLYERIANS